MIDLSELMTDPDFAQSFQIQRSTGSFANEGEYSTSAPITIERIGIVQPSKAEDMVRYLPEGERQKNAITIYCAEDILMADGRGQESDVVIWKSGYYRVAYSKPWQMHGYYFAIATGFVNA